MFCPGRTAEFVRGCEASRDVNVYLIYGAHTSFTSRLVRSRTSTLPTFEDTENAHDVSAIHHMTSSPMANRPSSPSTN